MVRVRIKIDVSQIPNFEGMHDKVQQKSMNLISQTMLRNLQRKSPVDTGLLRKWFKESESSNFTSIKTPAQYAVFVNDGTGPIYPKKGKALRFKPTKKWNGPVSKSGFVFLKYSKGQKGQHFVEDSIKETRSKIDGLVIKAVREVLTE